MKIAGLQPFTLSDFPGKTAAILFAQGCNLRCPYCHNRALWPTDAAPESLISENKIFDFLERRKGFLDGVVVTGGEPAIQPDLLAFLRKIRGMGFAVKLDTNGCFPHVLRQAIEEGLVDFIAMDVKAPLQKYSALAGVPVRIEDLLESISIVAESGVERQFRTTKVDGLLSDADMDEVRGLIPNGNPYRVQSYRAPSGDRSTCNS